MASFVDSDVVVFAFTNNPRKDAARKALEAGNLVVDTLVLLESYSKVATIMKDGELAAGMVRQFYRAGNIEIVGFGKNLLFEAVKRISKYNLKISDMVHYTTALLTGCSSIISYDSHFDGLEIKRTEP